MKRFWLLLVSLFLIAGTLRAQTDRQYGAKNRFLVFGEYANDSSHIILGRALNRGLTGAGVGYERRLVNRRNFTVAYAAEFRPLIISSDPAERVVSTYTDSLGDPPETFGPTTTMVDECNPGTSIFNGPVYGPSGPGVPVTGPSLPIGTFSSKTVTTCVRETTFAQGVAPIGFVVHTRPRARTQMLFAFRAGYMFSTRAIPVAPASSFNFTFSFSGGFEHFYGDRRSARIEYILQHYSNAYTAVANPGVDAGFVRLTYGFGR